MAIKSSSSFAELQHATDLVVEATPSDYTDVLQAAGDNTTFIDIDLVLQPGDKIQVTPTSVGHIDTILTVTETFIPVG